MYRAKHNGYSDHNYPTLAGQSRDSLSHTSPVNTSDNISGGFTKLCWIVLQNRSISCNTGNTDYGAASILLVISSPLTTKD